MNEILITLGNPNRSHHCCGVTFAGGILSYIYEAGVCVYQVSGCVSSAVKVCQELLPLEWFQSVSLFPPSMSCWIMFERWNPVFSTDVLSICPWEPWGMLLIPLSLEKGSVCRKVTFGLGHPSSRRWGQREGGFLISCQLAGLLVFPTPTDLWGRDTARWVMCKLMSKPRLGVCQQKAEPPPPPGMLCRLAWRSACMLSHQTCISEDLEAAWMEKTLFWTLHTLISSLWTGSIFPLPSCVMGTNYTDQEWRFDFFSEMIPCTESPKANWICRQFTTTSV